MYRLFFLALLAILPGIGLAQPAGPALPDLAAHTLVVFNRADADSQSLAETYAKARSIPADRVIGLDCALTEEITRAQFDTTIRKPLEELFQSRGWMKRQETFLHNPVLGLEGTVPVQQARTVPLVETLATLIRLLLLVGAIVRPVWPRIIKSCRLGERPKRI